MDNKQNWTPVAWARDVADCVTGELSTHISQNQPAPAPYRSNIRPLFDFEGIPDPAAYIAALQQCVQALEAILPVYQEWTDDCGHDPSVGVDCTDDFMRIAAATTALANLREVTK